MQEPRWNFKIDNSHIQKCHWLCIFTLLSNSKSPVWYGSPCIWLLLGPRLHDVISYPQHEIASATQEIQKVVEHFPYLHQNGSLKRKLCCYFIYVLVIHVGRLLMEIIRAWEHLMDAYVIVWICKINKIPTYRLSTYIT